MAKAFTVGLLAAAVSTPVFVGTPLSAAGDTRSLKIYYVHTGEKAVITYKRNGQFDPRGLEQLNRILRDWRKNQPTKMDPRLFDLIWEVYRESGSHEFINVVCGFRSPDTNEMLRTRTAHTGVAKKSQHMLGKAMDFYIPDVKLAKLRELGMKLQVGGVGFYPTSGSPFVHMDVGGVRAWPRMDRQDLVRLFPNGKTMHIPADGKPLPGYQEAVADYKRRMASEDIQVASVSPAKHRGFFATLFGGGGADEDEDNSDSETPATAAPATAKQVAPAQQAAPAEQAPEAVDQPTLVASVNAPIPLVRPAFGNPPAGSEVANALMSTGSNPGQEALAAALPANGAAPAQQQFADLSAYSVPVPSLLAPRRANGDAEVQTAALDPNTSAANDQLADASVPLPVERPEVAEKLLASVDADPDAQDDAADQATLSPSIVTALEQGRADQNVQSSVPTISNDAAQAINAVMPQKVPQPAKPSVQMAALLPTPSTSGMRFNDAFDRPEINDSNIAAGIPTKGGRPSRRDADAANAGRATLRTEPKLTEKMVAQWALTKARLETSGGRSVKAPRFVSQTLRAQPTAVYTEGFKQQTASIDPARFNGSAVNFQAVKKFDTFQ